MPDECVEDWMGLPNVAMATDTMPITDPKVTSDTPLEEMPNNHPRIAGGCAKVLRLSRELGIPLMHSLSQLSYVSAKYLGMRGLKSMQERGRVQERMIANLTIFNRIRTIQPTKKGLLPSEGIPRVLVSGFFVVNDGENTRNKPCKPIKFDRMPSRREPLKAEAWKKTWTVSSASLDLLERITNRGTFVALVFLPRILGRETRRR